MGYDRGDSFTFDFLTKTNSILFKIERKTVTTIIFYSIFFSKQMKKKSKEMEICFCECVNEMNVYPFALCLQPILRHATSYQDKTKI